MKPIFKIALKFLIVASLAGVTSYYLYDLSNEASSYKKTEQTYDIINFGNSHGKAFDYNVFGINGKNMHVNGSSPYYFLQLYNYYKGNLNEGAIVIIPISYFSFGVDAGYNKGAYNNQFYSFLNPSSIRGYSLQNHADLVNIRISSNFYDIIEGEKFNKKKEETDVRFKPHAYALYSSNLPNVKINNKTLEANKIANIQQKAFNKDFIEDNKNYLISLIKDALDKGFKPILVTPPYADVYSQNFNSDWLEKNFYNNIEELMEKYKIPYFDYSKKNIFKYELRLFQDTHHLNQYGRIRFSKMFFKDLESFGYIKNNLPRENILENKINIKDDLFLEKVEVLDNQSDYNVVILYFNHILDEYLKSNEVKLKFLNGKNPIVIDLNKKQNNFVFFKLKNLNPNSSILFEKDNKKLTEKLYINKNQEKEQNVKKYVFYENKTINLNSIRMGFKIKEQRFANDSIVVYPEAKNKLGFLKYKTDKLDYSGYLLKVTVKGHIEVINKLKFRSAKAYDFDDIFKVSDNNFVLCKSLTSTINVSKDKDGNSFSSIGVGFNEGDLLSTDKFTILKMELVKTNLDCTEASLYSLEEQSENGNQN